MTSDVYNYNISKTSLIKFYKSIELDYPDLEKVWINKQKPLK